MLIQICLVLVFVPCSSAACFGVKQLGCESLCDYKVHKDVAREIDLLGDVADFSCLERLRKLAVVRLTSSRTVCYGHLPSRIKLHGFCKEKFQATKEPVVPKVTQPSFPLERNLTRFSSVNFLSNQVPTPVFSTSTTSTPMHSRKTVIDPFISFIRKPEIHMVPITNDKPVYQKSENLKPNVTEKRGLNFDISSRRPNVPVSNLEVSSVRSLAPEVLRSPTMSTTTSEPWFHPIAEVSTKRVSKPNYFTVLMNITPLLVPETTTATVTPFQLLKTDLNHPVETQLEIPLLQEFDREHELLQKLISSSTFSTLLNATEEKTTVQFLSTQASWENVTEFLISHPIVSTTEASNQTVNQRAEMSKILVISGTSAGTVVLITTVLSLIIRRSRRRARRAARRLARPINRGVIAEEYLFMGFPNGPAIQEYNGHHSGCLNAECSNPTCSLGFLANESIEGHPHERIPLQTFSAESVRPGESLYSIPRPSMTYSSASYDDFTSDDFTDVDLENETFV